MIAGSCLPYYRGVDFETVAPSGSVDVENTTQTGLTAGGSYPGGMGQVVEFGVSPDEVTGISFYLDRTGAPRGVVRIAVYALSGSLPTGAALAASEFYAMDSAPDTAATRYMYLSGWTPTGSTAYAFVFETHGNMDPVGSNPSINLGNSANLYADGTLVTKDNYASVIDAENSDWTAQSATDLTFGVYTNATPDTTPPTLTSPTGVATGPTSTRGTVSVGESGGTVYMVTTQSATTPSVAQIQAGQDHLGAAADASASKSVTATGVQTLNAGGLTANTSGYYNHFTADDAAGNDGTPVSSTTFATPAASGDDFELRFRDGTYRRRFGFGV